MFIIFAMIALYAEAEPGWLWLWLILALLTETNQN